MSTEVELFEFQDIPSRPSIRGYVGTDGAAKISAGGVDMPTFATDTSRNVTGLVGPGGVEIPLGAPANTVVAFGDSMTHRINGIPTITALSRSGGVATATATSHGLGSGQITDINNCQDSTYNVRDVAITYLTANTFSFPCAGADGSTAAVATKSMLATTRSAFADNAYWVHLNSKLGGALHLVRNAGVSSNTSVDMLARYEADVLAYSSAWVFFQIPLYNDAVNAGLTAAQTIYNCQVMLNAFLGAGRKVLLIGPPGITTGNTAAIVEVYLTVNKWCKEQAQTRGNVYFADTFYYSCNPIAATKGSPRTSYLASDGIHESPLGAQAAKAQACYDAIGSLIPRIQTLTTSNADNYGTSATNTNIWDFAPWTNTGGTINAVSGSGNTTGSTAIPAGLQVDSTLSGAGGTAVYSTVTGTDGVGYALRCVFTPSAANDYIRCRAVTAVSSSRFTAGQKLRPKFRLKLTNVSGSGLKGINATVVFAGTVASTGYAISSYGASNADCGFADGTHTIVGPDITIPSDGITSVDFRVQALAGAAGAAVTVELERMSLEEVA